MPTKLSVKKMDYNIFQFCMQQNNNMILFSYNVHKIITILGYKYMCKFICKPNFIDKKSVDLKLIQIFL